MTTTRRIIPIVGLIGIAAFALYMVTQLHAQSDVPPADFTNASIAEVHNREGHVLLRGQFAVADDQNDDDVERKAALQTAGTDEDATGQAEIEFAKTAPKLQEIEFSVRNLEPGAPVTFLIDGRVIGQATVDSRGRAELELDVPVPGTAASK